jgi:hypothetical protein
MTPYAWTRPWPTRSGLAEHDYPDQLIRVVLSPDAVIGRSDASTEFSVRGSALQWDEDARDGRLCVVR